MHKKEAVCSAEPGRHLSCSVVKVFLGVCVLAFSGLFPPSGTDRAVSPFKVLYSSTFSSDSPLRWFKYHFCICMLGLPWLCHKALDFILHKRRAPPHMNASTAHVLIDELPHGALFKALSQYQTLSEIRRLTLSRRPSSHRRLSNLYQPALIIVISKTINLLPHI